MRDERLLHVHTPEQLQALAAVMARAKTSTASGAEEERQTHVRIDRVTGANEITVSIVDQHGVRAAGVLDASQAREFARALNSNADEMDGGTP